MTTTAAYCASLDILRNAPATDREAFLLEKLRDTLEELLDTREACSAVESLLARESNAGEDHESTLKRLLDERDEYERSHDDLPDVKEELEHHREDATALREEKADLAREFDAMKARAELAEHRIDEMRRALHAITVTRRGNVLHVHLPDALHVPAPGWNHAWNTLSVPVITTREVAGAKRHKCHCCEHVADVQQHRRNAVDTTWLSYSPERT